MPKVSIILTSFNHDKYINEAIDSILNQKFINFELIIWDDGSTDNSWQIIESYSDIRIRAFRNNKNEGPVFGVNKAIFEVAKGEYIAIHHSDDLWEPNKLQIQVDFLDSHKNIGATFSNVQAIDERGLPLNDNAHFYCSIFTQPNRSRHEWLRYFFLRSNALCHPSILIRKQCYTECGPYRDMLSQLPDFDMWMRLCAKFEINVMADRLIKFRVRDGEMNCSGNRPEVRIRSINEMQLLLHQFQTIFKKDEIFKIFPEFKIYDKGENTDAEYVLARICLEIDGFFLRHLLAINILFDILNDPPRRLAIEKSYGFTIKDYYKITGQHDLFSIEVNNNLKIAAAERELQINDFIRKVDDKINGLNSIITEQELTINSLISDRDATSH